MIDALIRLADRLLAWANPFEWSVRSKHEAEIARLTQQRDHALSMVQRLQRDLDRLGTELRAEQAARLELLRERPRFAKLPPQVDVDLVGDDAFGV